MGNRIKGITVEIGGDTTGLDKALRGVNSSINKTQSALNDVNKLLKLDPSNTVLVAQKQQLLSQAVSQTSDKLEALESAQEQVTAAFQRGGYRSGQISGISKRDRGNTRKAESV